jgi:hypothetical protein
MCENLSKLVHKGLKKEHEMEFETLDEPIKRMESKL